MKTLSKADYEHPREAFLRTIDVKTLLPQREPMVMVSRMTGFHLRQTQTELDIEPTNLFLDDDGRLMATGLMEHVAQSCAAHIGYVNKYLLGNAVQIGVIGALKNFRVHALPRAGSCIRCTVDIEEEVFGMTLARARVEHEASLLAETAIKVALSPLNIDR